MKEINIEESKQIQVKILSYVDMICRKHQIKYSLYGGTLIGAIRHKGFIPWDDDIDIIMPREDYKRLIQVFDNNGIYVLHSLENDKDYESPYAKVEDSRTLLEENSTTKNYGIAIDIFPCDYVGDTKQDAIRFVKRREIIRKLYLSKLVIPSHRNKWYKRIAIVLFKTLLVCVNIRSIAVLRSNMAQKINERTKYSADVVLASNYGIKEIIPTDMFDHLIQVEFEGLNFYAFEKYHIYLSSVFGNYMQLPPEDKRKSPHTIMKMFWKTIET